jgi:hypothetical protein
LPDISGLFSDFSHLGAYRTFASASFCCADVVALDSNINLIVATLDLQLVRSIRDAIHSADAASGKLFPVASIGPAPNPDRFFRQELRAPEPVYKPRRHIHPEPLYERRPVIHPTVRVEPKPDFRRPEPCPEVIPAHKSTNPIQPPWKVLPWNQPPAQPAVLVKRVVQRVDIHHKGNLLDLFL